MSFQKKDYYPTETNTQQVTWEAHVLLGHNQIST